MGLMFITGIFHLLCSRLTLDGQASAMACLVRSLLSRPDSFGLNDLILADLPLSGASWFVALLKGLKCPMELRMHVTIAVD